MGAPLEVRIHFARGDEDHQLSQPGVETRPEAQELIELAMERIELRAVEPDPGRPLEADQRTRIARDLIVERLPGGGELVALDRR